jgi:hypothetical protein
MSMGLLQSLATFNTKGEGDVNGLAAILGHMEKSKDWV